MGKAFFFTGDYERAIELLRSAAERVPDHRPSKVLLAAAAAQLGRTNEAQAAVAVALNIDPDLTVGGFLKFMNLVRPEDTKRMADGMHKAGFAG